MRWPNQQRWPKGSISYLYRTILKFLSNASEFDEFDSASSIAAVVCIRGSLRRGKAYNPSAFGAAIGDARI